MLNKNCDTIFTCLSFKKVGHHGEKWPKQSQQAIVCNKSPIVAGLHPDLGETGENHHNLH